MDPCRILLVQLFSNGDCLYATAVAKQIKADFPEGTLTWAISPSCKNMILNNPYVDEMLVIEDVARDDEAAFRRLLKRLRASQTWSRIVVTHIMGDNQAHYDGCIRSAIFRAYKYPLTVDVQPVLRLFDHEWDKVRQFSSTHHLNRYQDVILFEFAPLSGQSALTMEVALQIAERLVQGGQTAVILSSAKKIKHAHAAIIDGSQLTIRETAALSHHCNFLIGCSSGITWITTSDAGKELPMVQLLNPDTTWMNPISRDSARFSFSGRKFIELYSFTAPDVVACVQKALTDFITAKKMYHQEIPVGFKTTRNITYNLLCYLRISSIARHIRINYTVYGHRLAFYKEVLAGFAIFPFRLIYNFMRKRRRR